MTTNTNNNTAASAPKFPEQVTGMYILAESLKRLGLMDVYGLVGIPVTEAAYAMQKIGINYYGFRFEQQAGMAAARGARTVTPKAFPVTHSSNSDSIWGPLTTTQFVCPLSGVSHC